MKGCFKFFVIILVLMCAASLARFYLFLTPEQQAAETQAYREKLELEEKAAKQEREAAKQELEANKAERERIDALKPEFIVWLQKNAGVETGRFAGETLEIKYAREWSSKDQARVKAEALAHAWRLRSGLDYAECAIYWGNEIYATGVSR